MHMYKTDGHDINLFDTSMILEMHLHKYNILFYHIP
jgi:hypothetical protein